MRSRDPYDPTRRQSRAAYPVLVALVLLLLLPTSCLRHHGTSSTHATLQAQPDRHFDRLFTRFGDGWTGGDGTLSIGLPDGRSLWLFGDTFLGLVRPDGSRPLDSPLIRNCLVIQDGETLTARHGGSTRAPSAFLTPPDPEAWYWPADGTVVEDRLQVFFHRFRQVSPGMWGWAWDGTVIATLRLPDLVLERVTPAVDDNGVAYGSALLESGPWVYIFGTLQRGAVKHLHLARVSRRNWWDPWQFWAGDQWSADAAATRPLMAGVSSQFGVLPLAGGFGLVTMDERTPFSARVVLYWAEAPTGPWRGPAEIYQAPEADGAVAAYNPFVHPQFDPAKGYLISYNINHVHDPERLYDDAGLYRPRFIRADLERLAAGLTPETP